MKAVFLCLFIFTFTSNARAGFILAAGASFNSGNSTEGKASNDKSLVNVDSGTGIILEGEIPFLAGFFSLTSSALFLDQDGVVQYNSSNSVFVPDVKTKASTIMGTIGARVRFINFKKFKLFVGGGGMAGNVKMKFDQESFTSSGGVVAQFREEEIASSWGGYLEAGTEYIINNKAAVRAAVRLVDSKTKDYDRIAGKKLELDYAMFNLSVLYNFDWKFRKSSR